MPTNKQYPLITYDDGIKPKLIPHSHASRILKEEITNLAFDPVALEWMAYQSTNVWEKITEQEQKQYIEQYIYKLGGQIIGYQSNYVRGVNELLQCLLLKRFDKVLPRNLLPFKNGILDLNTKELLPHKADYLLTWRLPYDYTKGTDCQSFIAFIKESLSNKDQIIILQAFINAVVIGRSDLQKYLELFGFPGSGKSVLITILIALVGSKNSRSTSFKILAKDKFETANFYGKRLIIVTDAEKWSGDISLFKALIGQDPLRFEEKKKQAKESFVYQGLVAVACNHHIAGNDNSSAMYRRKLNIWFNNVVLKEKCDPDLAKKLSKNAAQILNWALELSHDEVTDILLNPVKYAPSMVEQQQEAIRAINPIASWALDNLEPDSGSKIQIGVLTKQAISTGDEDYRVIEQHYQNEDIFLYPNFALWFDQNNHNDLYNKKIGLNEFKQCVIDILKHSLKWNVEEIKPKNRKHIKGIRFKKQAVLVKKEGDVIEFPTTSILTEPEEQASRDSSLK